MGIKLLYGRCLRDPEKLAFLVWTRKRETARKFGIKMAWKKTRNKNRFQELKI